MAKVLIIFGSSSDRGVFEPIYQKLRQKLSQEEISLRICSAHRTPDMLDTILRESDARLIISGAGLAAHLPGVIAARSVAPVIGVPVKSQLSGIDSLLSIVQMPPGVPVLAVGIEQAAHAADAALNMLVPKREVNLLGNPESIRVKRCIETLESFGARFAYSDKTEPSRVNIRFVRLGAALQKVVIDQSSIIINVPFAEESSADTIGELVELTTRGLWVGINREENAAIAAVQILNTHGRFKKALLRHKEQLKENVQKQDAEIRGFLHL